MEYVFSDIHSHVLPRIDDGSDSMEKSIKILKNMSACGTRELFVTPHYCVRRGFKPSPEKILAAFDDLKSNCENNGIDITLHCGCEIEYSSDIPELLKSGNLLTLAGSKYILMEFAPYTNIRDIMFAVQTIVQLGFIPVIAHIERYSALKNNIEDVIQLKDLGAKLQMNIDYIVSRPLFRDTFLKAVISLQQIDFIAGDVHRDSYTPMQLKRCIKIIQKYSSTDYVQDVFYKNAEKILNTNEERN